MPEKYYALEIIRKPSDVWGTLLRTACKNADMIEWVVPKDVTQWPQEIRTFLPSLLDLFVSKWRWQRKQRKPSVFVRFRITPDICAYLQRVPRLEEWIDRLPEDPAFYRDGEAILWTISHDGMAFLRLSDEEAASMSQQGYELTPIDDMSAPTRKTP